MSADTGAPLFLELLAASQSEPEVPINANSELLNAWAATHGGGSDASDTGGSISVTDGTTTVFDVTEIHFTGGATVTDSGGGVASVAAGGGGGSDIGGESAGARITLTGNQTVATSTNSQVLFDATEFDTGTFVQASPASGFVAPKNGLYAVSASVLWDSATSGSRKIFFVVNNVDSDPIAGSETPSTLAGVQLSSSTLLDLSLGDTVEVWAWHDDGTSIDIVADNQRTTFSMALSEAGSVGGSLTLTDGTHTVTAVTEITASGLVVGGSGGSATLTSSGGGGGGNVNPDTHPASPDATDDEFEEMSLDAKWTLTGTSGATAAIGGKGEVNITSVAPGSANQFSFLTQVAPSAPWKYRAKLANVRWFPRNGTQYVGMCARNSGNTHFASIHHRTDPMVQCGYGTGDAIGANISNGSDWGSQATWGLGISVPIYYEIENDGTTLFFRTSFSGYDGSFVETQGSSNSPIATCVSGGVDQIGIFAGYNGGTGTSEACFDWFRRVA